MAGFRKGFETQTKEVEIASLPVQGKIPAWLSGTLVRNTPAQFKIDGQTYRHWFDGLAMLHAFTLKNGTVSYANRYLQSKAYKENNEEGRIKYAEFATDPCRSLFSRFVSFFKRPEYGGNANVNVTRLADEYIARTEYPMSIKFDPETLETLGVYEHEGMNGSITTAHPHHDYTRDTSYNYMLEFGRQSKYRLYGLPDRKNPTQIAEVSVNKPAYIHSFGMSEQYLILAEFPLKLGGSLDLLIGNEPFIENYEWMPDEGTRIVIIDKDTGETVTETEVEPFFAFHHVNAFERDGELIVDLAAYEDSSIINRFYMDHVTADRAEVPINSLLRRYRIPLAGGSVSYDVVSDQPFDLPRYHYRRVAGQPYRYAYGAGSRPNSSDLFNQMVKFDLESGEVKTWYEENMYPGEPVFVPARDGSAEDEGVILSVVLDGQTDTSFLLILDAPTFEEQARAPVPQHIPFGFHGQFFD